MLINRAAEHVVPHRAEAVSKRTRGGGGDDGARLRSGRPGGSMASHMPSSASRRRAPRAASRLTVATRSAGLTDSTWSSARVLTVRSAGASAWSQCPDPRPGSSSPPRARAGRPARARPRSPEWRAGAPRHRARRRRCPAARGAGRETTSLIARPPVARHSRHAWKGTTLPGLARSAGSNTRRTARIAPSVSASKIHGM